MMSGEPWKTDQWFSSPWNYLPEVTEGFSLPERVTIHDVTLRDGEQQAGVEFTADDKVRIAEALSEAGIHRIEAGLPAVSPADTEAVKRILTEVKGRFLAKKGLLDNDESLDIVQQVTYQNKPTSSTNRKDAFQAATYSSPRILAEDSPDRMRSVQPRSWLTSWCTSASTLPA
jgi:hypothetical protein